MQGYFKNKRILVLLAHPDDETLGCGGTIHRATQEGATVSCYIPVKRIKEDCNKAMNELGVTSVHFGKWKDQLLDTYPLKGLADWFSKAVYDTDPHIVILNHYNCTNQDHRVCHQAGIIATRNYTGHILSCEVPSSTGYLRPCGFEPNFYVELSSWNMNNKIEATRHYKTELKPFPNPRNVNQLHNLAQVRGGECGNDYAEGFMLVRGNV